MTLADTQPPQEVSRSISGEELILQTMSFTGLMEDREAMAAAPAAPVAIPFLRFDISARPVFVAQTEATVAESDESAVVPMVSFFDRPGIGGPGQVPLTTTPQPDGDAVEASDAAAVGPARWAGSMTRPGANIATPKSVFPPSPKATQLSRLMAEAPEILSSISPVFGEPLVGPTKQFGLSVHSTSPDLRPSRPNQAEAVHRQGSSDVRVGYKVLEQDGLSPDHLSILPEDDLTPAKPSDLGFPNVRVSLTQSVNLPAECSPSRKAMAVEQYSWTATTPRSPTDLQPSKLAVAGMSDGSPPRVETSVGSERFAVLEGPEGKSREPGLSSPIATQLNIWTAQARETVSQNAIASPRQSLSQFSARTRQTAQFEQAPVSVTLHSSQEDVVMIARLVGTSADESDLARAAQQLFLRSGLQLSTVMVNGRKILRSPRSK